MKEKENCNTSVVHQRPGKMSENVLKMHRNSFVEPYTYV